MWILAHAPTCALLQSNGTGGNGAVVRLPRAARAIQALGDPEQERWHGERTDDSGGRLGPGTLGRPDARGARRAAQRRRGGLPHGAPAHSRWTAAAAARPRARGIP